MKTKTVWIRRDKVTGDEEPISKAVATRKLRGSYSDVSASMRVACREAPLTTSFADYFPVVSMPLKSFPVK